MKNLLENWNKFTIDESVLGNDYESKLEYENGKVVLYHVSTTEDISILDPIFASKNLKIYSKGEYRAWDRPRVFFFTKLGQKDSSIGRIQGKGYKALIDPDKLYPVMKDPKRYSYPDRKKEYLEIRLKRDGKATYYPVNTYEMVATLSALDGYQGFMYNQHNGDLIVAMWVKVPVEKLNNIFYQEK